MNLILSPHTSYLDSLARSLARIISGLIAAAPSIYPPPAGMMGEREQTEGGADATAPLLPPSSPAVPCLCSGETTPAR